MSVYGREGDRDRCVHKLDFMDNDGNSIGEFDPLNAGRGNGKEFNIRENESLIGVYGVKDVQDYFTSLGFIVKVQLN